jgi:uncharacterized protein (UPF0333 family)
MNKKGQAAMEFLMTYGWAILVVIAAIAALAYFGVLNPDRYLPEKCTLPSGIACLDSTGSTSQILLRLQNAAGFDMTSVTIELIGAASDGGNVACTLAGGNSLTNGAADTATCTGTISAGKLSAPVELNYTNQQTTLSKSVRGDLILKID